MLNSNISQWMARLICWCSEEVMSTTFAILGLNYTSWKTTWQSPGNLSSLRRNVLPIVGCHQVKGVAERVLHAAATNKLQKVKLLLWRWMAFISRLHHTFHSLTTAWRVACEYLQTSQCVPLQQFGLMSALSLFRYFDANQSMRPDDCIGEKDWQVSLICEYVIKFHFAVSSY